MKNKVKLSIILILIILPIMVNGFMFPFENNKPEKQSSNIINNSERKKNLKESLKKLKDIKARHQEAISKIIKLESTSKLFRHAYPKNETFCTQLFEDFKADKVELILPIAHSDNFNDKSIQKELKPCFKKNPEMQDKAKSHIQAQGLTESLMYRENPDYSFWRNDFGTEITEANFNFKLYKVDFDNNPSNGLEYVLFSSGFYPVRTWRDKLPDHHFDRVAIFNINKCNSIKKVYDNVIEPVIDYKTHKLKDTYYEVIKYKGKYYYYYLIENSSKKGEVYGISFIEWADMDWLLEILKGDKAKVAKSAYDHTLIHGVCGYSVYK